jgi:hypothetical protein
MALKNRNSALSMLCIVVLNKIFIRHALLLLDVNRRFDHFAEPRGVRITWLERLWHHVGQIDDALHTNATGESCGQPLTLSITTPRLRSHVATGVAGRGFEPPPHCCSQLHAEELHTARSPVHRPLHTAISHNSASLIGSPSYWRRFDKERRSGAG